MTINRRLGHFVYRYALYFLSLRQFFVLLLPDSTKTKKKVENRFVLVEILYRLSKLDFYSFI